MFVPNSPIIVVYLPNYGGIFLEMGMEFARSAVNFRKRLRFPRGGLEPPHFVAGSQHCRYSPAGVFAFCSNQQLGFSVCQNKKATHALVNSFLSIKRIQILKVNKS